MDDHTITHQRFSWREVRGFTLTPTVTEKNAADINIATIVNECNFITAYASGMAGIHLLITKEETLKIIFLRFRRRQFP
jgi:hypothetical protein